MTAAPDAASSGDGERVPSLLVLTNLYPAPDNRVFGSFVAKQVAVLAEMGVRVRLVANTDWHPGVVHGVRKYASLAARTLAAAPRGDFEAIVGHFLYPTAWFARVASRISGKPYALVVHGGDVRSVQRGDPLARACLRAVRAAALVVPVSRAIEREVREDLGVPASVPTEVINMGVDRTVFHPVPDARERSGWDAGARVAVFAGNLIERKGVQVLLPAFASLHAEGRCDMLVVVGDGPARASLEQLAARLGVEGSVRFTGALPPETLAETMAAADAFVLPSLAEPLGVVLLEAMACGTPCVGSDVGGIPEVVGPGCGRLAPPGDPAALAAALGEVLDTGKDSFREACLASAEVNDLRANTRRLLAAVGAATRVEA